MSDSPQETNIYYARIKMLQKRINSLEGENERMVKWMELIDKRLAGLEVTTHEEQIERKLNTAVCDKVGKDIEDAIDEAFSSDDRISQAIDVHAIMVEAAKAVEELHDKLTEKYPTMYFGQDQLVRRMNKWRRDSVR
tara:strand:- start:517 stop:927 length:411 start_codon:yes stop_codon:yes gene_type:complete